MTSETSRRSVLRTISVPLVVIILLAVSVGAVSAVYQDRIVPGTTIGSVSVSSLSRDEAAARVQERLDMLEQQGVRVQVGSTYEVVQTDGIGLDLNIQETVERVFERGHTGPWWQQSWERFSGLWSKTSIAAPISVDTAFLEERVDELGTSSQIERRDVRLAIDGTRVELLTDTRPGQAVDTVHAYNAILGELEKLSTGPVRVELRDDAPRATVASGVEAQQQAVAMIAEPLVLVHDDLSFAISRTLLGSWLINEYEGNRLVPSVDVKAVAQYIARIADQLNVPPVPAGVETEKGKVVGFTPPQYGKSVQEGETVAMVVERLHERRAGTAVSGTIALAMRQTKPPEISLGDGTRISELIGKATTPFTGSPKNRTWNITNGSRFLSGIVIEPGEEFSTLNELGTIDNTTGYLPELVIKGDRTIPEFGGGLCQVSTTLFRAVMDAGLPITERRNHSRRVSYYEKDEYGQYIGPGLDATIYDTGPDFRFLNDTGNPVLVISYVEGSLITFELYGTHDGRTSEIIGPTVLSELSPGDPVYIETDELLPGETKQVEWAIPGGSAVTTYVITYEDGTTEEQEFKSYYRRWPDKFLIGRDPLMQDPTEGLLGT